MRFATRQMHHGAAGTEVDEQTDTDHHVISDSTYLIEGIPKCVPMRLLVCAVAYFVIGAAVYTQFEGWDGVDSVYFCMVTMSTVGYGDISPSLPGTKIFTLVWIFLGVTCVFSQVGACLSQLLFTPITTAGRNALEKIFPKNYVDIDGDGDADFAYPRHFALFYSKGLAPSVLLNLAMQLANVFQLCSHHQH